MQAVKRNREGIEYTPHCIHIECAAVLALKVNNHHRGFVVVVYGTRLKNAMQLTL